MKFGTAFLAIWASLAIASGLMYVFASPKTRREFWMPMQIIAALALVTAAILINESTALIGFSVFAALVIMLNAVTIRICAQCGLSNRNTFFFPVPKFCNRCGHSLEQAGKTHS
ncbi:hypothetical protein sos41_28290 [Alphaproteobacteria bacterium SO-S41]|nr:hypothetical protein sos41_28290 [Alphaproteobacteria bacterium SO-S41]